MKKITKLLLMTAIAIGMVACSNDDNLPDAPDANAAKGNTYASISIKLPKGPSTRAGLPDDYNKLTDDWEGIDAIETITVFLVNETLGTIDHSTFGTSQFEEIDGNGVLKPNLAVKATPGEDVKAYVVLNGNAAILSTLQGTSPADFDTDYAKAIAKIASELAENKLVGTENKDVIMMTNTKDPVGVTVVAGVTEDDAKTGSENTIKVDVERVVSRAIVTAKADAKTATIDVKNAQNVNASTITIKDLKYVVGQSNKEFYMIKQDGYKTPETVYDFVPTALTWNDAVVEPTAIFDNEGLGKLSEVRTATGADALDKFKGALEEEGKNSKFVLPVTHDGAANYKKGNTTFFEVIATFTPNKVDGEGTYTPGSDVFLGMNDGLFYTTRELAEAKGQKATMYKGTGTDVDITKGAIMKYVLWLNPNEIPGAAEAKATMSPTVRNQVYHAHIKGFKQIGLPNNPLNPGDPNSNFPENPINPIKPEDPLQTDDTYLSVEITVVPWGIHSYEINLGNYY